MSWSIDYQKLIDIILKAIGLPPPSISSANSVVTSAGLQAMGITPPLPVATIADMKNAQPKKIPFSGLAGYSERGAPEAWDLAMGEVYGYRWWYLVVPPELVGYIGCTDRVTTRRYGTLYGANNQSWQDGRLEARCTSNTSMRSFSFTMDRQHPVHQPPETREACGCGFWAYFNRGLAVDEVMSGQFAGKFPALLSYGAVIPVFGVVKGTGRVIIGEKGFRCQYAQIMGLCIPPVTVNQLSWWLAPGMDEHKFATGGIIGVITGDHGSEGGYKREKCSEAEHVTRIAQMEAVLSATYPGAKLFTSQDLLTQYYPPDKNYS